MQRTTATGATAGNLFTNGDPVSSTPATVIDSVWLNSVQEELCNTIIAAGITLNVSQQNQLVAAIQKLSQMGASPSAQTIAIANNQATPANLAGLLFNSANVRAARILFSCYIQTDLGVELQEVGNIYVWFNPIANVWKYSVQSEGDDAGVVFSITAAGQLQYTSANQSFTSTYVGQLRVQNVLTLAV